MSFHRLSLITRVPRRSLHASACCHGPNPLFHLQALSTSRETQWMSKATGLSRVEHSPGLQLLRSEAELQQSALARPPVKTQTTSPFSPRPTQKSKPAASHGTATLAQPWIRKLRQDLDEMENAVVRQSILNQRYSPGIKDADALPAVELEYEKHMDRQAREIETLRTRLSEERTKYAADKQTWTAVKMTMNSHKERAETAGALSIVIATVLAAALYYQYTHPSSTPVSEKTAGAVKDKASTPHVVDAAPLSIGGWAAKQRAQPPSAADARPAAAGPASTGFFWQI